MKENKTKMFDIFKEWTESMTMHGFPNIFRTKFLPIKIMWIILFLASTSACFFLIISNLINFFNFEVVTKIRVIKKDSILFPAITICNINPFVTQQGLEYVQSFLEENNLISFTEATLDPIFQDEFSKLNFNYNLFRHFLRTFSKSISNEQKKKLSLPFDKMFISCLYNLRPCNQSQWTWFYNSEFGNCYRFNSDQNSQEIQKTYQAGKYNGLMIELYVGIPEEQNTLSQTSGAHVYIDDNSIQPLFGQGVDIAPGFGTNLVLQRIKRKQMPKPYSSCNENLDTIDSFDSEYYRKVFRSNLTYRQEDCFFAFIQSEIYKKCKCDDMGSNLISENNNPCDNFEEQNCALAEFQRLTQSSYKKSIESFCPLECESITFGVTKSISRYPSVSYGNDLVKTKQIKALFGNRTNISIDELRENILSLNIYYEYLKQTEITENRSINWDGLVGSIGGTLGLFLGISFLSFVEIIDLIFQIVFLHLKKNTTKVFINIKS
ncbi:acid-sensing ion channel 1 isoform X2 [Brachionus plicatilis]|uniref:Acid-sensing ion channel 1 isoform X2 n=1 Tax=Brachionus plicatilis TaxID=10195 RepID=A0A3M7RH56_BRAPC|nr:acid-sensing ion channel 1 isoform X2 [Brachionus plicatilis]